MNVKKLFVDKRGDITIWQTPNMAFAMWFVATLLTKVVPYGRINFTFSLLAFGSLFTWCWMEFFDGDSFFRRGLGLIVLVLMILNRI